MGFATEMWHKVISGYQDHAVAYHNARSWPEG